MAIIKSKEMAKMSMNDVEEKLHELRVDLIKARVPTKKVSKGAREIKRTIAKLLTLKNLNEIKNKEASKAGGKK